MKKRRHTTTGDGTAAISPAVLAQEIQGETVLLDLEGEAYYGLNETGTRVWQLLKRGCSLPEVLDTLESEYDVSRAELEADVKGLLESLKAAGLVSPP